MTTPPDRPSIGLGYWLLTAVVAAAAFVGLEAALRADLVWRLPLGIVKAADGDRHLEAAWEIHQPPGPEPRVIVLGASNTAVALELPRYGLARVLNAVTGKPVTVLSLCLGGAKVEEYMVLLEAALEEGHLPAIVVIGIWPGQLVRENYDPLLAERMPFSSSWLLAEAQPVDDPDSLWERYGPRVLALERFRHAANAWLHRRLHDLLLQRFRWVVGGQDAANDPRLVPLDRDKRQDVVDRISEQWLNEPPDLSRLRSTIRRARDAGSRVIVLEAPWSPPVRREFALFAGRYRTRMASLAREEGAVYVDPNEWLTLGADDFADLVHVRPKGQQRYAGAVVPKLAAFLR